MFRADPKGSIFAPNIRPVSGELAFRHKGAILVMGASDRIGAAPAGASSESRMDVIATGQATPSTGCTGGQDPLLRP